MATHPTIPATPPRRRGDRPDPGRVLLGGSVVAAGVILLLGAAGVVDAGHVIGSWWPVVIVAGGLLTLAERPPALFRGGVLTDRKSVV